MSTRRVVLPAFCLPLLCSCVYGYSTTGQVTRLSNKLYPPSTRVDLVFEMVPPERKYEQLAYIEITGGPVADMSEMMDEMRARAGRIGADAVVAIRKSHKTERQGSVAVNLVELRGCGRRYRGWQ